MNSSHGRLRLVGAALCAVVLTTGVVGSSASAASVKPPKPGTPCVKTAKPVKVGTTAVFRCVKSGNRYLWARQVVVVTPPPVIKKSFDVKIADFPVMELGALFVGRNKGYFTDAGINLSSVQISGAGAVMIAAMLAGSIDIAPSNVVSVMQANSKGQEVQCFADITRKPSIGRHLPLLVSPKVTITKAADFSGKTIAVNALGGTNELIARVWLKNKGVDLATVKIVAMAFPDIPNALASGAVDAAIGDEPFTTLAVAGGAKVFDPRPYQEIATAPVFSCWATTGDVVKKSPDMLRAFAQAMTKASDTANSDRTTLESIMTTNFKMDPSLVRNVEQPLYGTSLTVDDMKIWADTAKAYGLLDSAFDPAKAVAKI